MRLLALLCAGGLLGALNLSVRTLLAVPQRCSVPRMRPHFEPLLMPHCGTHYAAHEYTEHSVSAPLQSTGANCTPAVFVPGQGGDYRQVRSLASKSAHAAEAATRAGFEHRSLSWATLDLHGELAFLESSLLQEQSSYVACAVQELCQRYGRAVILVGHSVGAVAARIAARSLASECIELVISLGSPLRATALMPSFSGTRLLDIASKQNTSPAMEVCGGSRDLQAPPHACGSPVSFTVSTRRLDGVSTSLDHNAMVWCAELMSVLAQALTSDAFERMQLHGEQVIAYLSSKSIPDAVRPAYAIGPLLRRRETAADAVLLLAPRALALAIAFALIPSLLSKHPKMACAAAVLAHAPFEFVTMLKSNISPVSAFAGCLGQLLAAFAALGFQAIAEVFALVFADFKIRFRIGIACTISVLFLGHPAAVASGAALIASNSALGTAAGLVAGARLPSLIAWVLATSQRTRMKGILSVPSVEFQVADSLLAAATALPVLARTQRFTAFSRDLDEFGSNLTIPADRRALSFSRVCLFGLAVLAATAGRFDALFVVIGAKALLDLVKLRWFSWS